ncbi:MAG TPA: ABC transporter ATP-binding protein [Terriglobales bacterium]|nr:ABC transporter ATP-binding protein [Terriglobales bacterium]
MEIIRFESVDKFFGSTAIWPFRNRTPETHALKGVSLVISPGEVLGLLGPNGSGKSTTLKLISTTLLPDAGRVVVHGFDTQRAGKAVRERVGFVLASERSFFPRLTVRENLEFFAALDDVPRRGMSGRIRTVLSEVDLECAADKQAMKLSSGMYQRLGIARALIKRPSVLLLDEPTRSLDAAAKGQIWKLIEQASRQGVTVLLATHNFEEAASVCDRVALLYQGELIGQQTTFDLRSEQLRDFYMEMTSHCGQEMLSIPA